MPNDWRNQSKLITAKVIKDSLAYFKEVVREALGSFVASLFPLTSTNYAFALS